MRWPTRFVVLFCAAIVAPAASSQTGAESFALMHADLARLPPDTRLYSRYFDVRFFPDFKERVVHARVQAGHCNGMSSRAKLTPPALVDKAATLLRIDLRWYGWTTETWELLSPPFETVTVEGYIVGSEETRWWEGGIWPGDSKRYDAGAFKYKAPAKSAGRAKVVAPWLSLPPSSPAMVDQVYRWTGSRVPMVSADWFLVQTATQEGKRPGYYDFQGVKNQKDFERLIRFDSKLGEETEHYRSVAFSGIGLQPRRLAFRKSTLGWLFETFDNEDATGVRNPLDVLNDALKFDITEKFGPLLNGLIAWYLGDDKGNRADKALDKIVGGDRTGGGNDTRLQINLGCIRCHMERLHENGIKDLNDVPIRKFRTVDYDELEELTRRYLRNVGKEIKLARLGFEEAYREATGWAPAEYAHHYGEAYRRYYDARVDLKFAAARLGTTEMDLAIAWQAYDDIGGKLPGTLSIILKGGAVPVRQFESVFHIGAEIMYGTKTKGK